MLKWPTICEYELKHNSIFGILFSRLIEENLDFGPTMDWDLKKKTYLHKPWLKYPHL